MPEPETAGVQKKARCKVGVAVQAVADDGSREPAGDRSIWRFDDRWGGAVNAELVRAARDGAELDAGGGDRLAVGGRPRFVASHDDVGAGGAAVLEIDLLKGPAGPVDAVGEVDGAGFVDGIVGDALDERNVPLADATLFELAGELAVGFRIERHHEQAAGVHVEPVAGHGAGGVGVALLNADAGAVGLVLAPSRDAEHARGLLDDDEAILFVHDFDVEPGRGRRVHAWGLGHRENGKRPPPAQRPYAWA